MTPAPLIDASVVQVIGLIVSMITPIVLAWIALKGKMAVDKVDAKADANLAETQKLGVAVDGRLTLLLKRTEAWALATGEKKGRAEKGAEVKAEVAQAAAVAAADVTVTDRRVSQTGAPDGHERRGEDPGTDP